MATKYTSKHGSAHKAIDYQGNDPKGNPGSLQEIDDVKGCGHYASPPDDVKGHAGHLCGEEETKAK